MANYKHYTYRISWSEADQEYVALCAEFPSVSFLAKDQAMALHGIVDLIQSIIKDMMKNGEVIPQPLAERIYSGKFQIRTTPEIHRLLTIRAAENHVSLNRYINSKLINVA